MTGYSNFAKFYDFVFGDRLIEAAYVEKLVKQHNPSVKKVLELGCGTGTFLKYFFEHSYDVTGIDISAAMLAIARQKLPDANLLRQNMVAFSSLGKYDAILCLFDSINHLLNYKDWKKVFLGASLHLNKNGVFIFDINTEKKLEDLVKVGVISREFDGNKMFMKITARNRAYNWDIKIVKKEKNSSNVISVKDIQEQSFPLAKIKASLKKIFKKVVLLNRDESRPSENSQRVYFVCLN